ncbi:hypothetical protein JCM14469_16780 [Desulfatiferula olefinivorans]
MIKEHEGAHWIRMSFKGNKVWAETDGAGEFLTDDTGKVRIKYNLKQDYEYRVHPDSLKSADPENLVPKKTDSKKKAPGPATAKKTAPHPESLAQNHDEAGVIHVFTDGASSGNPGPSGIGIFFRYGDHEKEISRYIGQGTNNIAELEAIRTALSEIKKPELPVRLYSDSSYALGLLTQNWKPKKNVELVESIKALMKRFSNLTLIKVSGHSGVEGNEKADRLATSAIERER